MTYITEQTSAELRRHIRSLQKMPGWSDAVTDRLWKEIEALSKALEASQELLVTSLHYQDNEYKDDTEKQCALNRALLGPARS